MNMISLIQEIAEKLGLDTTVSTSLWKDTALIEVTRAVLYSFQVIYIPYIEMNFLLRTNFFYGNR